jgi:formylglycine-generating enzyme
MLSLLLSLAIATAPSTPVKPSMARIPAGSYQPLYGAVGGAPVVVEAFFLDREPVTRGEYLVFVRAHPQWRRGAIRPIFAGQGYLSAWQGDLDAGTATDLRRPVTEVSWFAARAYCESRGKRLPTVDEWEYAASASETRARVARDPKFIRRILAVYAARPNDGILPPVGSGFRNVYGVRDLHGSAWEWTLDFNDAMVSGDSRESGSGVGGRDHMLFCASAAIGASDPSNYPAFMRYAFRAGLTGRSTARTLGFRCAAGGAAT